MATPLETNTTSLQELLSEVSSLPEPVAATTQATPTITVSSAGVITATSTQEEGHVASGTKTATKQLTTQVAKTITPSTSSQTAVASGVYTTGTVKVAAIPSTYVKPTATKAATTYTPTTSNQTIAAGTYCSGAQTIAGDADLVSANIKSGANIFGVAGSASVVDTSDATAKVSDMVDGVTAYVNGEKVTGNVPEVASSNVLSTTYSYVDNFIDSTVMNVRGIVPSDTLCRSSSVVNVPVPASVFGDATAADVVSGKTFTSSAGLMVTGTAETASIEVEELSLVNGGFYGDQNIVISHADTSGYYYNVTITTKKEIKELAGLSFKLYWKQSDYKIYLAAYSNSFAGFSLGVIGWMYDDSVYERGSNTGIIQTDGAAANSMMSFSGNTITISELTSYVLGEYYSQFGEYPDFTDGNWEINGIVSYTA